MIGARGSGSRSPAAAAAALVWAAALLAGCDQGLPGREASPRLIVAWTGSDTGAMAARVVAEWCDSLRALEIRAIQGDSGLAVVLYPRDSVSADSYPVLLPDRADSTRPSAAVGARWFAETSIKGYQGDRGAVVLEGANGRVSGRLSARMRSVSDGSRLELEGTFQGVPIVPAPRACVAKPPPYPPDSGVS